MTHDDAHVSELLSDYMSGHLEKDEADRVAAHVRGCTTCRSELGTLRMLEGCFMGNRVTEKTEHISEQELWQYYDSRDSMDETSRKNIGAHIGHCFECSSALDLLTGLEQDLVHMRPLAHVHAENKTGFGDLLFRFLRKPVLAYALLALTVYPTARWLIGEGDQKRDIQVSRMPENTFRLTAQLRSATDALIVSRRDREALLLLELPFYVMPDGKTYEVTVSCSDTDSNMKPAVESIVLPGPQGIVNVLLNTASLADGLCELSLLEIDRNNLSDTSISRFTFTLKTGQ